MLFSLKWLKEMVSIPCTREELVAKFNLMSSEVEDHYQLVTATNLTVGYVKTCIMHPQSDHLHICEVDVAKETLQIVCGAPNVAAGQKVIVALEGAVLPGNFKIKKSTIRGVESNGMICSLDELGIEHKYHQEDGIHVLPESSVIGTNPLEVLHFDDEVIELSLTPNRGDLLSMMGIAYDVSAMLDTALTLKDIFVKEVKESNPVKVSTQTPSCKSYYARVIRDVEIKESPEWLKARLIASGIRPINNVVDITNYVMLETGQPLHAFDFDKLKLNTIVVRNAIDNETIVTLDGKTRILVADDIVITDGHTPVALAGVMGGESTQIDQSTKAILLESAIFDGLTIRKTSKRLDLRSESSSRFERGLDPNRTLLACNRAAGLFEQLANGKVLANVNSFENQNLIPIVVDLSLSKLIKVTGYQYSEKLVSNVLKRLHFEFKLQDGIFKISVPTRRIDIKTYQDIIEEIVRIAGYELIPTTLPKSAIPGSLTEVQKQKRLIRETLSTLGLNETITYSLTSESEAKSFDADEKESIQLLYPIVETRGTMRHSQIPALLEVLNYNLSRKAENVHLFEIGKGYSNQGETEFVSGLMTGVFDDSKWQGITRPVDFFVVKGILETLFNKLNVDKVQFLPPKLPHPKLHPGISAEIIIEDISVGLVGKLHPSLSSEKGFPDTYVFEVDLKAILSASKPNDKMKEVSKFPSVSRDLAIVIDRSISAKQVIETLKKAGKKTLIDINIFDVYQGEKVALDKKSIALSLTFQDNSKTLSTEEIDLLVSKIVKAIATELNGELRS